MKLTLILFGLTCLKELLLWTPLFWRRRKLVACLLILALAITSGLLVGFSLSIWAGLVLFVSIYRLVNLLRLVEGRTQADYLFSVSRRSSWLLIGAQLFIGLLALLNAHHRLSYLDWAYIVSIAQLICAINLLGLTKRHLLSIRPPASRDNYADRDLPSLSVAIPARNETVDLEACLQTLVASNYPKLEILVLDDCSQNKRTPEIIRDFAHAGVIFIAGEPPPERWLAKNYAYQQLANEANGELILFCGVDARFEPDSLRQIVEVMLKKKQSMISLLPKNALPAKAWSLQALLIQPARYAWELSLPRTWLKRPPVLSTCWVITAEALREAGSFKAIERSSSPESYFARSTDKKNGYSFLSSNKAIGLSCDKSYASQRDTAVRSRYPQLHRRPELVAVFSFLEFMILVAPFGLFVVALVQEDYLVLLITLLTCILLVIEFVQLASLTYRKFLFRSLYLMPVSGLSDIIVLNYSMWQYEFREVIWKGRNVCLPILQPSPDLPDVN